MVENDADRSKWRWGGRAARRLLPVLALVALGTQALQVQAATGGSPGNARIPEFYTKRPAPGTPIDVLALRIIYDSRHDVATAVGSVKITYGPYVLHARKVIYDRKTDQLYADGHVTLREPKGNVLIADYVNIDDKFRNGFARHLRLLMTNDATLKARYAVRRDGYLTIYTDVRYTRCKTCRVDENTPLWEVRSREAIHDEKAGRIYHKDMTFRLLGMPLFWLPRFSHPDPMHPRSTGFLMPRITNSGDLGVGISTPFFINLAPNYDLTLYPAFYTKQGLFARAVWRHRLASGTYEVDAGGIRQQSPSRLKSPGDRKWRGYARAKGNFRLNSRWSWGFDGTALSDRGVMRKYDIDSRNMIESKVWLTGLDGRNYFQGKIANYRGLLDDDQKGVIPYATFDLQYHHTFRNAYLGGELSYSSYFYSLHRKRENIPFVTVAQGTDQTRAISELIWQRRSVSGAGIVTSPFARIRGDFYVTRNLADPLVPGAVHDNVTSRILPSAGLDIRWPFMRSDRLGQHVISPVAQLIAARNEYREDRISNEDSLSLNFNAHSLFLHNRFSGHDRFEGGVRANVGLLYSLFLPSGGFLRASIGQSYHLAGQNSFAINTGLAGDYSDIVAAIAFNPNEKLRLSWQGRFDARDMKLTNQELRASLSWNNLGGSIMYTRISADPSHGLMTAQEQIYGLVNWKFHRDWKLFGSWLYDLEAGRNVRRSIGIGYDCDCIGLQLEYTQDFTRDADIVDSHTIRLSVDIKTLGGVSVGKSF